MLTFSTKIVNLSSLPGLSVFASFILCVHVSDCYTLVNWPLSL